MILSIICNVFHVSNLNIGRYVSCTLGPFQLISYSVKDAAAKFYIDRRDLNLSFCLLSKALAKFPDNATEIELQWLNESYVDLEVLNKTIHLKVRKNTIILLFSNLNKDWYLVFLFVVEKIRSRLARRNN